MNNMKILVLLLTFINLSTFNLGTTYKTKEEIFLKTINEAYDTYTINDVSTIVGVMYVVVGKVSGDVSFSVFFNNEKSSEYNVNIKKNDSNYVLSKYDDYQVYYDIKTDNTSIYVVELKPKDSSVPFYSYAINLSDNDKITGEGRANFPYHTKLRNRMSSFGLLLIIGIPVILLEGLVIILVLTKKQKKQKQNINNSSIYSNIAYTVEDNNEEE